jgi:hypothetical protein
VRPARAEYALLDDDPAVQSDLQLLIEHLAAVDRLLLQDPDGGEPVVVLRSVRPRRIDLEHDRPWARIGPAAVELRRRYGISNIFVTSRSLPATSENQQVATVR